MAKEKAPDCMKCVHYKVTYDPAFPRGCGLFGLKSRELPSFVVYRSTGHHCPSFVLSPKIKKGN